MIDTLYLLCGRHRIEKTTKRDPGSAPRGMALIRLDIEVEPGALQSPTLIQSVRVRDWRDGISTEGMSIPVRFIDEALAEKIRLEILGRMQAILEEQGYQVTPPEHVPAALPAGRGDGG